MIERSLINIDERAIEIGTAYCSSENFVYSVHLTHLESPQSLGTYLNVL